VVGNVGREGGYGVWGQDAGGLGKVALDAYAPGYEWAANALEDNGTASIAYPAGTFLHAEGIAHVHRAWIRAGRTPAGVRVGADVAAIRAIFQTWGLGL
jgi:hypothetical protein